MSAKQSEDHNELLMNLIRKRRFRLVKYGAFSFVLGLLVLSTYASHTLGLLVFGILLGQIDSMP